MNLQALIALYLQENSENQESALQYAAQYLEAEIPSEISDFIGKLANKEPLLPQESEHVKEALDKLDPKLNNAIVGVIRSVSNDVFASYQSQINAAVKEIDANLENHTRLTFSEGYPYDEYKGLLNVYLARDINLKNTQETHSYNKFPYKVKVAEADLMFGINALVLNNKIPKNIKYGELDLSRPLSLDPEIGTKTNRRGIKKSEEFYPYKKITKITAQGLGNDTYVATNGNKVLYVRDRGHHGDEHADSVLASEIATIISKETFAAEWRMDSGVSASKKLPGYISALSDNHTHLNEARAWMQENKTTLTGQGTVDEVLNFVFESDLNTDNFGFSSPDIARARLLKIDFDQCHVTKGIGEDIKKNYEQNIASRSFGALYDDPKYIDEKLSARLMLSMFSEQLYSGLVDKAFLANNNYYEEDKAEAVEELVARSAAVFDLFLENEHAQQFLKDNPDKFNEHLGKFAAYVESHFDEPEKTTILQAQMEKAIVQHKELAAVFPDLKISEPTFAAYRQQVTPKAPDSVSSTREIFGGLAKAAPEAKTSSQWTMAATPQAETKNNKGVSLSSTRATPPTAASPQTDPNMQRENWKNSTSPQTQRSANLIGVRQPLLQSQTDTNEPHVWKPASPRRR